MINLNILFPRLGLRNLFYILVENTCHFSHERFRRRI